MTSKQCEIVGLSVDGSLFGVELSYVKEFVWLPYLTPVEEQAAYVLGTFELRGALVRVVDINLRLGRPAKRLSQSDTVLVTQTAEGLVGLVCDELLDTGWVSLVEDNSRSFEPENYRPLSLAQFTLDGQSGTLIDPQELIVGDRFPFEYLIERSDPLSAASPEAKELLLRRRSEYSQQTRQEVEASSDRLAIVEINGAWFGFDIQRIQEFTHLGKVFALPNTPAFLVGHVNLRGELVTVFDISGLLNIDTIRVRDESHLVVFTYENQLVGFIVDDLVDVIDAPRDSLNTPPIAIDEARRNLFRGEYVYQDRSIIILDVERVFTTGQLVVDQE